MSRIALGLMRISKMSINEVEKLIISSIDKGITIFDLADIYGNTMCETLFGEVMKLHPELRNKIYIQTKIGIVSNGYDLSYDYIINQTKTCLKRLNIGYLDCLLLHRPDLFMDNKEISKAIDFLIKEKIIKDFGVSNFSINEIKYLEKELSIRIKYNQVQLGLGNTCMIDQTLYTNIPAKLVSKESDSLFFYLKSEGIIIQCWSPYQYGFFEGSIFNKEKYPLINEVLEEYAEKYQTSKCAIATSFLLKLDNNLIVVTGSTNILHIQESLDGEKINLSKGDWYEIYRKTGHMIP